MRVCMHRLIGTYAVGIDKNVRDVGTANPNSLLVILSTEICAMPRRLCQMCHAIARCKPFMSHVQCVTSFTLFMKPIWRNVGYVE